MPALRNPVGRPARRRLLVVRQVGRGDPRAARVLLASRLVPTLPTGGDVTRRERVQAAIAVLACLVVAGCLMGGVALFLLDQLELITP